MNGWKRSNVLPARAESARAESAQAESAQAEQCPRESSFGWQPRSLTTRTAVGCWAYFGLLAFVSVSFVSVAAASTRSPATEDKLRVINAFVDYIKQSDNLTDEQKQEATELVVSFRDDEYSRDFAVTEGLAILYPEYSEALEALGNDDVDKARQLLGDASESGNPYLAADATFYLARSAIFEEHYEFALPMFDRVLGELADYSVQQGNATYFKGMCQAALLQRDEAKETLAKFMSDFPNAPERMKISAQRRMYELEVIEDGTLYDVFERMDFSRRHLELEKSGDPTQQQQDEIVKILDRLIKQVEDQESQSSSSNTNKPSDGEQQAQQGQQEGPGQSQQGGGSKNPDGVARRTFGTGPKSPWSELRDRARDPAFSAIKEKYPARYQKIIEQYYKSFQEDQKR